MADTLTERAEVLRLHVSVHFTGPVPHESLPRRYQGAAIAVFPFSGQQGFGLVMVEAMGCGCMVIASDLPAVRDVIRDGETGILVPPGDPPALAAAIREALEQPERTRAIAKRGQAYALEHFDWSVTCRKFAALYRSLPSGQSKL